MWGYENEVSFHVPGLDVEPEQEEDYDLNSPVGSTQQQALPGDSWKHFSALEVEDILGNGLRNKRASSTAEASSPLGARNGQQPGAMRRTSQSYSKMNTSFMHRGHSIEMNSYIPPGSAWTCGTVLEFDYTLLTPTIFHEMIVHRRVEVLTHPLLQAYVCWQWNTKYARIYNQEILEHCLTIVLVSILLQLDGGGVSGPSDESLDNIPIWCVAGLSFLLWVRFAWSEFTEIWTKSARQYFSEIWNWCDVLVIFLVPTVVWLAFSVESSNHALPAPVRAMWVSEEQAKQVRGREWGERARTHVRT